MERAPQFVIYALHIPYCLYLMVRYRGLTLPTIANPGIDGSGLSNESKAELFELMGPLGRRHLPAYVAIEAGADAMARARQAMVEVGLSFPFIVKPDIGRRGFGVKLVHNEAELAKHLARFPAGIKLLMQRYAAGPGEVAVFYLRMPSQAHGKILALTIKHFPEMVGDGRSTLRELIVQDDRARAFAKVYFKRNREHLDDVLAPGERFRLVTVGNHVRGAAFENGSQHITPAMEKAFDTIAQEVPGFFIGRFDVRYTTLEALKRGEEFSIVEYNGAGGEPTHIWDPRTSIAETYAGLLEHWKYLYAVGAENRARGERPMSLRQVISRFLAELRLISRYPDEE
ncbi:D-alanine--D-alanine ligase [Oleiagrimonas sp. C23AA]|uniref:D-alanine--D-alanine ligase n=1 Tax=Oleiagrimonas sp. C23AA TaxID=2719047 RepID=UPI0014203CA4|nr:D-alanine--D-alanine ligase [Oleiagrimonas sp. C23AA]NII11861.1 D-alanine--D-alanine ligase [Oleiagrimonas sp. C23AA]